MTSQTISLDRPLCLGSGSPRRRELLTGLSLPIRIVVSDVDEEVVHGEHPLAYLERVTLNKLRGVAAFGDKIADCAAVLVADTIVRVENEIIGKPSGRDGAYELLRRISGREHLVHTRYAIAHARCLDVPVVERTITSRVWLRAASEDVLRRYADTGEGLDKAGAYAVQGIGAFLVERIDGSYSNVVGLPVCEVVGDLMAAGLLEHFP